MDQGLIWWVHVVKDVSVFLHDDNWLHTIWDGFLSSLVGAVVALAVVLFTVHHQKKGNSEQLRVQTKGLAEQLRAQAEGLAEQLAEQRRENAKDREHAAGADILQALQRLPRLIFEDEARAASGPAQTCMAELRGGFERLRLELKVGDDAVISELHTWATLIQVAGYTVHELAEEEYDYLGNDRFGKTMYQRMLVVHSTEFLAAQVAGYIRSGVEARQGTAGYLSHARKDLAGHSNPEEWAAKYYTPSEWPYARDTDADEAEV